MALPDISKSRLPTKQEAAHMTKVCQAAVPGPLLDAARKTWRANGLTTRQVVQWALVQYLKAANPKAAAKLKGAT